MQAEPRGSGILAMMLRVLRSAALLGSLVCISACGRLGFELHEIDAGRSFVVEDTSGGVRNNGRSGSPAPTMKRDAGRPPSAASGASSPDQPLQAPNGGACATDEACESGACVAGTCCESRCDAPPACYRAEAKCDTGHCQYVAAPSGEACDDDNACTTDDRCQDGVCAGASNCDDDNACTGDFCGSGSCAHASTCQPDDVGCSYAQRLGHGYWLCPGPVTFDAAQAECRRIGAKIATINDEAEQAALWQLGMRDTWIGYRARAAVPEDADAGFAWVEGQSDFEAWADEDLDAGVAERCAFLSATEEGAWQSRACDDAFSGFACELEQYAAPEASCRYERRGAHGYFSCESERTWSEAQQRCVEIGGYLVEPDSSEEHAFVLGLLKPDARYAIGVTDAQSEGQFVTARGGRISFSAWDAQEPSAQSAELDYAVLTASGA
ncbi:MAG TPA: C-type lectin domain-containing protein, partial [Polyangiales bacterium]|nr:C-type lectin domain-containing protein [Polyangiales bacterium]